MRAMPEAFPVKIEMAWLTSSTSRASAGGVAPFGQFPPKEFVFHGLCAEILSQTVEFDGILDRMRLQTSFTRFQEGVALRRQRRRRHPERSRRTKSMFSPRRSLRTAWAHLRPYHRTPPRQPRESPTAVSPKTRCRSRRKAGGHQKAKKRHPFSLSTL